MTNKTWKIRDQLPTGKWGLEREVTLAQYKDEIAAASAKAKAIYAEARLRVAEGR